MTELIIAPKTKVAELIDAYPQLEQVLIDYVPAFEKLKKPGSTQDRRPDHNPAAGGRHWRRERRRPDQSPQEGGGAGPLFRRSGSGLYHGTARLVLRDTGRGRVGRNRACWRRGNSRSTRSSPTCRPWARATSTSSSRPLCPPRWWTRHPAWAFPTGSGTQDDRGVCHLLL